MVMRCCALSETSWQPWPALAEQVEFTSFYTRDSGLEGSVTHWLVSVKVGVWHIRHFSIYPVCSPFFTLIHFSPVFPSP